MELVKDLTDEGIKFYWIDESGERLSSELVTLNQAQEWRNQRLFDSYAKAERRASIIDRRSDLDKRDRMINTCNSLQSNPQGRRVTDIAVEVDIDLVKEKLQALC